MNADTIEMLPATSGLSPLSLKDAPSFIEVQFPVGRLSAEAYKERKAGAGQTLTALGSYWKGRKPLILCRAVVLGCLLPATDDPAERPRHFPEADGDGRRSLCASVRRQRKRVRAPVLRPGPTSSPKRLADGGYGGTILTTTTARRALQSFRSLPYTSING